MPPSAISLRQVADSQLDDPDAAQASRDRKKEHTAFLERRVAQLEQLLQQAGRPAPAAVAPIPFLGSPTTGPLPPLPGSRLRASSVSSNTSSSEDSGRVADLEDENESLRAQLAAEQGEKARLLTRLELVEEKLARLTTPDAGPISFSPFSGTSTPLPAYEPTFAFNTADIKPLPQPEERAFVEQRERERRRASQTSFDVIAPLGPPLPGFDSEHSTGPKEGSGSSRLVAREVDLSLQRKLPTLPSRPCRRSGSTLPAGHPRLRSLRAPPPPRPDPSRASSSTSRRARPLPSRTSTFTNSMSRPNGPPGRPSRTRTRRTRRQDLPSSRITKTPTTSRLLHTLI